MIEEREGGRGWEESTFLQSNGNGGAGHTGKKDCKRSLRPGKTVKAFLLYFSCESPFPC